MQTYSLIKFVCFTKIAQELNQYTCISKYIKPLFYDDFFCFLHMIDQHHVKLIFPIHIYINKRLMGHIAHLSNN